MKDVYKELKEKDYFLYREVIQLATSVCINNNIESLDARVDLEKALVYIALK
jgi:hypothetical protein